MRQRQSRAPGHRAGEGPHDGRWRLNREGLVLVRRLMSPAAARCLALGRGRTTQRALSRLTRLRGRRVPSRGHTVRVREMPAFNLGCLLSILSTHKLSGCRIASDLRQSNSTWLQGSRWTCYHVTSSVGYQERSPADVGWALIYAILLHERGRFIRAGCLWRDRPAGRPRLSTDERSTRRPRRAPPTPKVHADNAIQHRQFDVIFRRAGVGR